MNKVYKVVWSDAANAWVAVSEISTAHGKSKSSKTIAVAVAAVGMMLSSAAVQAAGLTWGTGAVAADDEAIAMGNNSDAKTNYTIVLGSGAKNKSNGESAVVIGHGAEATSDANPNTAKNTMGQQVVVGEASVANSQSVALGAQVYATGQSSIAIGGDDLGNNDSKTSAGKYSGAQDWRNYAGQPITVEGVSTKDASNPAIGFTSTTASGRGSVAIGHMSQSTGKASLAFGADSHAEADGAIAAGMASQAKGSAAVAIGVGAEAPEAHATAIGLKAKANGGNAFAAGSNAKADGENSIALGYGASTETNSATYPRIASQPDKTMNNIAIGKTARSGGLQTIAFGAESVASKTQSIAFGFDAQATGDQSVALGANTRSTGDSSVAIGGDDLDSVASTVYRVTSPAADNDAYNDTALAKKYRELTGQNLVNFTPNNRYIGTSTGQAGVAVGVSAKAADLATAVGTKSHATGDYSAAFGVGANATLANAVALGAGSTTATNATDVPSATIGAITYGGGTSPFAGSGKVVPGDQVSIGAAGFERQIKHVAPGAITAASTDAINGSQLFYVAKGLQEQITAAGGNGIHFYHVNGANTDNNYNNDGATGSKALAAGINAKAAGASSVAVGSAEVAEKSVVGQSNSEGAVAIGDSAYAAGRQAVTLGASRAEEEQAVAIGSNARSSGKASMAIGAAAVASQENNISIGSSANTAGNNSVAIGANSSTVVAAAGSVALGHASQATRAAIDATKVQANAAPTVANNQVYALASASNVDQNNITATVKGELGAVSVGTQNATRQIINVAAGTEDSDAVNVAQLKAVANQITTQAVATTPLTVANDGKVTPPAAADAGKLATAGDIANAINSSGFKATAGGNTTGAAPTQELIKAGDTLTLKAGDGLTVEQSGSTFTYALNAQQITQNAQTPVVYTKADGSKVYKHTDGNFYDQPNGAGTQVAAGDVIASMNAGDNTTSTPTTLANVKSNLADAAAATANPANNSRSDFAGKGNNAATVNDVLNAGFNVQGNGVAKDFVTHGDTINFVNGQGTVANVTSTNGVTEVKFDTPLSYADAAGNNTGTPSNAVNLVGDTAGSPVTLGNVADGVKDTDAVNVKQLKDSQTKVVKGTNIASVDHDAATNTYTVNAKGSETSGVDDETVVTATPDATTNVTSYKVGLADKVKDDIKKGVDAKDAVDNKGLTFTADSGDTGVKKLGDSVAIKGDRNIVTSADASGINMRLADVLNIGPSTGGNPVTINGNTGTIGGLTNKTWDPNSITSGQAATEDQLKLVADQAGQKGSFTLTAQGANGSTVGDGSTVDLNNTDGNIVVSKTASDNNVTFNLAKDLKADSLTINNGGPVINGNGINMGDKKITNVADGDVTATSKDAVNGSQLYAVQQEAQKRNTVKAGNNVTVTEAPNANGGTEYTINAEKSVVGGVNDETVVTATNDPTTNTTTYNVGLADKVKDDIKKGADAADAVNKKGLTFKGDSGDTGVKKLGDEVSITGDSNITTKADGNGVQVSLNRDVNVDSVKAGDSTLNNDGLTINGGPSVTKTGIDAADKKVTNVANGDVTATSKDAVNGSQLHQHGDGVKNIIGGNTTYDPNTGSYTNNDIGGTGQSTIDDAIRHINSTANAGWNLQTNGGATEKVGSGETVNFKNGNNISITNTGKEITIATNPDLTADSLTINNGGPVINGNGINMGDKKITNVADGDVTATSKDAVNGSQLYATNQNVANNTANIAKGFNFGDGNTANNYQLGDTISVKGDNNVTSTTVNGGVQLGLNQNLSLTSVTTGNTKMDNNGLTINGGPSVTTNGVDAGGKKITNVAAGEADTDAVNVGQLNQKLGAIAGANTAHVAALEQKINNVEDEADAGTASAMATAGLPQAYLPGKSMIAVGASNYRGKTGYAVGFSAITDGGNWIIKGTASGNSKGRFGASIGAGYQW